MKSKPLFKNRFVAFVDILGFQDIVKRMETTPELAPESAVQQILPDIKVIVIPSVKGRDGPTGSGATTLSW